MFLVSCYYTVSSFSCTSDVSFKNLALFMWLHFEHYETRKLNPSCLLLCFSYPAALFFCFFFLSSISPLWPPLILYDFFFSFRLFILLFWLHPDSFWSHFAADDVFCAICAEVCAHTYKISKFFTIKASRGAYDRMEICSAPALIFLLWP